MEFVSKEYIIRVETGLRIGAGRETFEIGGLDNPVIKIAFTEDMIKNLYGEDLLNEIKGKIKLPIEIPYIPGSSLKGKMRFMLEKTRGIDDATIINFFGKSSDKNDTEQRSSKLIFRDAYPTKETIKKWIEMYTKGLTDAIGTEIKMENKIDRTNGQANPRSMERIIPGSEFEIEVTIIAKDQNEKEEAEKILEEGFSLLEKTYLGGSGSRGYGKIKVIRKE